MRRGLYILGTVLNGIFLQACSPGINGTLSGGSLTVSTIGSSATDTTVTLTSSSGTAYSSVTVDQGSGFTFDNITWGNTIFGRAGYASSSASNILRDKGTQLSSAAEVKTYAGSGSSPTLPSGMRDIPDVNKDDEAYDPTSPAAPIASATHTGFTNCGTTQATIALRIADCASKNGTGATWDGATHGIRGEATWKLVARNGSKKEVWQDQRTGLLWTSLAENAGTYTFSWCQAAGNVQNNTYNCSAGGGDQPATPRSFCKEMSGFDAGAGFADTPLTGPYAAQKGGMGLGSNPSVQWRLPTVYDYMQAEIDGIRMVMPDMNFGYVGPSYEWTSTLVSNARGSAWFYSTDNYRIGPNPRNILYAVRCVGR